VLKLWFQMWIDGPAKTEVFRPAIRSVAGR
jgi:hypothetical protein